MILPDPLTTPRQAIAIACALTFAALLPAFASCAEAEDNASFKDDANVTLPPGADAQLDVDTGIVDAGTACDAASPDCVSHVVSCNDVPWCPVPTNVSTLFLLNAVWGSGPNDVWAVGSGGTIAHYDGTAWKTTSPTPGIMNTFRAVWGSGPNDVWAVAMTDSIYHSNGYANGGAEWLRVTPAMEGNAARAATAIWGTGPNDVRIGARAYAFYDPDTGEFPFVNQFKLTRGSADAGVDGGDGGADAGATIGWSSVGGSGTLLGFWGAGASDIWIVVDDSERVNGAKGVTRHGTLDGKGNLAFVDVDSQAAVALEGVWGSSPNDVWAVGDKGTIRHIDAGKTRWDVVASPTGEALHAIWGAAANDVWAVGDKGTILHFDGGGWKVSAAAFGLGTKPNLYGVWGSSANDVWIVGDGVALHYTGPKGGGGQ